MSSIKGKRTHRESDLFLPTLHFPPGAGNCAYSVVQAILIVTGIHDIALKDNTIFKNQEANQTNMN